MSSSVGVMTFPIWKNHQGVITSNWCSFWIWLVLTHRVEWKNRSSPLMSSDQPYPTDHGGIYDLPWIHGVSCYEFGAISRSMFELTQQVGPFRQLWMICSCCAMKLPVSHVQPRMCLSQRIINWKNIWIVWTWCRCIPKKGVFIKEN